VTHDEVLARRTAHRIVRLTDGRIVGDDATALVA
jgi:predicted ABC-type transport system involved in lysophospholipase L1 biosynthesis ATPase subunit